MSERRVTRLQVVVFCLVLVAGMPAGAQETEFPDQPFIPGRSEEICGTWINRDYGTPQRPYQRCIMHLWGYAEAFTRVESTRPAQRYTFVLVKKWPDSAGNLWYLEYDLLEGSSAVVYYINKVSPDGTTCETVWSMSGFPRQSDLFRSNPHYQVFYKE